MLPTLLGLRYLLLNSPLADGVPAVVVKVAVLLLSLYLEAEAKFVSSVFDLDVDGEPYLLDPLLRDLPSSLLFDVVVSVRGASTA